MSEQFFHPERFSNVLGPTEAVMELESGDIVSTETIDAHGVDRNEAQAGRAPNPMTGPFAVADAKPGDTLAVTLLELRPNRPRAWTRRYLSPTVLTPELLLRFPEILDGIEGEGMHVDWLLDAAHRTALPAESAGAPQVPALPLAPMIGCIGVAPPEGQSISTATSGPYGGNMDYVGVCAGATLSFPVFQPGALLYLGDGHATQGHGEIGGTGTEVSMDVRFRVELVKSHPIEWPRGETDTHIFAIGNARPLELALQYATSELFGWIVAEHSLSATEASLLLAQGVEYAVGTVYDPAFTIVARLAKRFLPSVSHDSLRSS